VEERKIGTLRDQPEGRFKVIFRARQGDAVQDGHFKNTKPGEARGRNLSGRRGCPGTFSGQWIRDVEG
jgi:hypothetical protein